MESIESHGAEYDATAVVLHRCILLPPPSWMRVEIERGRSVQGGSPGRVRKI